jgi:biotin carboxylase
MQTMSTPLPTSHPITILCLASYFKGGAFLQASKQLGCHVILLTAEKLAHEDWPRESIDEFVVMPQLFKRPDILYTVSYLARARVIDAVVALDDFDVETAAHLREHLRLPGMGDSPARYFRDKLAMRIRAQAGGLPVPEFTAVFNYDRLREFMARVPPPWLLKPRSGAGTMGIKQVGDAESVWRTLDTLGDQQSFFLLEQFVPADVFHVDALVDGGAVRFAIVSRYARPPLSVYHEGGLFITHMLDAQTADAQTLLELNRRTLQVLGMERGAAHVEFLRSQSDGRFYFLECGTRVGGAHIAEAIEFATGINLWREWAATEFAYLRGEPYRLPERRYDYAGIVACLAHQEWPDTSVYDDPEIVWRLKKHHHAGLIVCSPDAGRVKALLDEYAGRFTHDFLAVLPPRADVPGLTLTTNNHQVGGAA